MRVSGLLRVLTLLRLGTAALILHGCASRGFLGDVGEKWLCEGGTELLYRLKRQGTGDYNPLLLQLKGQLLVLQKVDDHKWSDGNTTLTRDTSKGTSAQCARTKVETNGKLLAGGCVQTELIVFEPGTDQYAVFAVNNPGVCE